MMTLEQEKQLLALVAEQGRAIKLLQQQFQAHPVAIAPGRKIHPRFDAVAEAGFAAVRVGKALYEFSGQQAEIVRLLWPSLNDAFGLTNQQIGDRLGMKRGFKVVNYFRDHPAWKTFIHGNGNGRFWLVAPLRETPPLFHESSTARTDD